MTEPIARTSISVTIGKATADRLEAEADARMIGKGLLVEKALDFFFDRLPPLEATEAKDKVPEETPEQKAARMRVE